MQFDVFHSIGRIDTVAPRLTDRRVFDQFIGQAIAAEDLGYRTMWVAESHFSSEVQKHGPAPVMPHYHGEVGLNADSMQICNWMFGRTRKIGFGTAIMNIVGGNGGPIAAADRVRMLAWLNHLDREPRPLDIGVAAGRFPYINRPFGITPRNKVEEILWRPWQQMIFAEALEIFLRLSNGEILSSADVTGHRITPEMFGPEGQRSRIMEALRGTGLVADPEGGVSYEPRWRFDPLKLVPEMLPGQFAGFMRFVLGSHDPYARRIGSRFADLDVFNLSFTPPAVLNATHAEMAEECRRLGRIWHRSRMPRTVLIFIDRDAARAQARAEACFDTYIEAMRGTVTLPPRAALMERALIGTPAMIREQLGPDDPHGFHPDDRLMLWFEFNQTDHNGIIAQMRMFAEEVMPHYS